MCGATFPSPLADGFAPAIFLVVLIILVAVVLIALAVLLIACVLLACLAIMIACGIVSASVIVAVTRKSVASGFRVFFLASGTTIGIPVGIILLQLILRLAHHARPVSNTLPWGACLGAAAGFIAALFFNQIWTWGVAWVSTRFARRTALENLA